MEKERFSRRFSAMARTSQQLPGEVFITFGVQAYVVQDYRAAQAVCGPDMAVVVAKSAQLRFRLAAKTMFASLLLLSPPQPLRWVAAGTP